MRGVAWAVAITAVVSIAGVAYVRSQRAPPVEVEVARLARGAVRELVPAASSGEVKPARRVSLRAELAGTVRKVTKRRGERVKEGELLLVFDSDELLARREQARANVESAGIAEKIAATRAAAATRTLERARSLVASGAIAPAEVERAETEAEAAAHAVEQAGAARKQAGAAEKLATVALERSEVHAPFPGVLQEVSAELGVMVAPGSQLFDLIDDSSVVVEVPFDEADAAKIATGQRVSLSLEGLGVRELWGTVSYVPPAMGKASDLGALESARNRKDRSLYVEVKPDDPAPFKVGASVNAELLVNEKPDVAFVPSTAVIGRGLERDVYLLKEGKARKVRVRAGLTSWERTEIVSGLSPNDLIISNLNVEGLSDGALARQKGVPAAPVAESK
ncbi:MAG: efflux RND transporter periplasmic adaptor subunit [Deltaproteobacteria bacterium]|nr:efflux RND transporter periplasmic adaptor subunit [Deltaproteobacteria bacterium]